MNGWLNQKTKPSDQQDLDHIENGSYFSARNNQEDEYKIKHLISIDKILIILHELCNRQLYSVWR